MHRLRSLIRRQRVVHAGAKVHPGGAVGGRTRDLELSACVDDPLDIAPGATHLVPTGMAIHIGDPTLAAVEQAAPLIERLDYGEDERRTLRNLTIEALLRVDLKLGRSWPLPCVRMARCTGDLIGLLPWRREHFMDTWSCRAWWRISGIVTSSISWMLIDWTPCLRSW